MCAKLTIRTQIAFGFGFQKQATHCACVPCRAAKGSERPLFATQSNINSFLHPPPPCNIEPRVGVLDPVMPNRLIWKVVNIYIRIILGTEYREYVGKYKMFANLAIRTKIMVGFGILLALIAIGAVTSSNNFIVTESQIANYRGMAKETDTLSLVESSLLHTRIAVKEFLVNRSGGDIGKVQNRTDEALAHAEAALQNNTSADQVQQLQFITTELKNYQSLCMRVTELQAERNDVVDNKIDVFGPDMRKKLERIMRSAYEDGDREAAYHAGLAQTRLMLMRKYAERYLLDNEEDSFKRTISEAKLLDHYLKVLLSRLENPSRRTLAEQIASGKEQYMAAFKQAYDIIVLRNAIITEELDRVGLMIEEVSNELQSQNRSLQANIGTQLSERTQSAVITTILLSVLSMIIGAVSAVLIGRQIIKPLRRIVGITTKLSEGNNAITIPDRERRDEIGELSRALEIFRENMIAAKAAKQREQEATKA